MPWFAIMRSAAMAGGSLATHASGMIESAKRSLTVARRRRLPGTSALANGRRADGQYVWSMPRFTSLYCSVRPNPEVYACPQAARLCTLGKL